GESAPTLLSLLDVCRTGMGSRALRHWLCHPMRDRGEAVQRHDAIDALLESGFTELRDALRGVSDVERITPPVALPQRRPPELAALRATLRPLPALRATLRASAPLIDALTRTMSPPPQIEALLAGAIAEEPAVLLRDGGVIADGFDAELDELRGISQN